MIAVDKKAEIVAQGEQEIRRGILVLSVLSVLEKPEYGYSLVQSLEKIGVSIEGNTLYPLLRRLEKQGLLISSWEVESQKPRKYYEITSMGVEVREELTKIWQDTVIIMKGVL